VQKPFTILTIGVNGTGKTTTIAKLAEIFKQQGHSVMLAAADTFRAAAIEQLEIWGKRTGCEVIKHAPGADPSAVAFDALQSAKAQSVDILIIDTAGRLHTKAPLMEELKKIERIITREHQDAPHETLLVLDATTGQNAISQAKIFSEALKVTGIALTKLDGTAKGGVIVGISDALHIPIRYIGVGEQVEDLRPFNADDFVDALFDD
jgi:fused signal recognition particle receptor